MTSASLRRRALFRLATSDLFEAAVRAVPPATIAARRRSTRYVAGERVEDALLVVERLDAHGLRASVDFFGEQVTDVAETDTATRAYVRIAERLPFETDVALDLSHIGLDVSEDLCRTQLERIVTALREGRRVAVGAEDSARTDATQRICAELARAGAPIQVTLQANLRRSERDWPRLVESGLAIRLVKGAYVEPPDLAHRYGDETDVAFLQLAHDLHGAGATLAIGTHDPVLRESLLAALGRLDVEMLLGVREQDTYALAARGIPVRVYVPYGASWFRYYMRRVAEAQGA